MPYYLLSERRLKELLQKEAIFIKTPSNIVGRKPTAFRRWEEPCS